MKQHRKRNILPGDIKQAELDFDHLISQGKWKKISINSDVHSGLEGFIEVEELLPLNEEYEEKKIKELPNTFSKVASKDKKDQTYDPFKGQDEVVHENSLNHNDDRELNTKISSYDSKIGIKDSESYWNNFNELKSSMTEWNFSETHPIHPAILTAIKESGFYHPLPIQSACFLPAYRDRKDIIGVAETGSGKTLAFGIPILCSILQSMIAEFDKLKEDMIELPHYMKKLRAIIIIPSRELAMQVYKHIGRISRLTPIFAIPIIGGIYSKKQVRLIEKKPDIIICTPGRLAALMLGNTDSNLEGLAYLNDLSGLRFLVLDEADRLLLEGAFKDLTAIIKHIYNLIPNSDSLQTFIFSATLSVPQKPTKSKDKQNNSGNTTIEKLINKLTLRIKKTFVSDLTSKSKDDIKMIEKEERFQTSQNKQNPTSTFLKLPDGLKISIIKCQTPQKELELITFLFQYLQTHREELTKIIIFVNTISYVYRLVPLLSLIFHHDKHNNLLPKKLRISNSSDLRPLCSIYGIHSSISQKQRLKNLEKFQKSKNSILVCTDVAARGLDMPDVNVVVHHQIPRNSSIFVHRSGRTARANQSGICVNLCGAKEFSRWVKLLNVIGITAENLTTPQGFDSIGQRQLQHIKKILSLANEIEKEEHLITKAKKTSSWIRKFAQEGELDINSEDNSDNEEQARILKDRSKEKLKKKKISMMELFSDKLICFT